MHEEEYIPKYRQVIEPIVYSITELGDKKKTINKTEIKQCIFCGRVETEASFKKKAHIFPAALGNRIWFNANECDDCNGLYFSSYEDDLCNFLMMDRIFIGSRKRKGFVKYKPQESGKTFIERPGAENHVLINIEELEGRFEVNNDENNKQLEFVVNKPLPYSLVNICKAITHMGWSFFPESIRNQYSFIADWLLGKIEIFPLYIDKVFVPGNGFSNVILEIREAMEPDNPFPLMIRFTFGMKILTFYLPERVSVSEVPESDSIYIQLLESNTQSMLDRIQINEEERIQPEDLKYILRYQNAEDIKIVDD